MVALFILFLSSSLYALEGTVVVLDAPVFEAPNTKSKIVQKYRKNQTIYLHTIHDIENTDNQDVFRETEFDRPTLAHELNKVLIQKENEAKFYMTVTKTGSKGYILKDHVKPLFHDQRDYNRPIGSYYPDRTDYRIEEPLPENFPFQKEATTKVKISLAPGLPSTYRYRYAENPSKSNDKPSMNLNISSTTRAKFDNGKPLPLYYGLRFHFGYRQRDTQFSDGLFGSEKIILMGLGPSLSYDLFKSHKQAINFTGSFMIYLADQYSVKIGDEIQTFSAITISPQLELTYQKVDIFQGFDFLVGPILYFHLPTELQGNNQEATSSFWGSVNSYNKEFSADMALVLGFQKEF